MKLPTFFLSLLFASAVGLCASAPDDVHISEFLALNGSTNEDRHGDNSDWIEIRNPTGSGMNLEGWFLTDDPAVLRKYELPSFFVPSRGYRIVFASGRNEVDLFTQEVHTNFGLSEAGEYLALVRPDGTIAHEFTPGYPVQRSDVSYGLAADGSHTFFATPTPGATNQGAVSGFVADTKFEPNRGIYKEPVTVAVTTETEGATIRYTTDNTEPSLQNGNTYTGPLEIAETTVLRVKAFKDGYAPTNIDTSTYFFIEDILRQSPQGQVPPGWPTSPVNGQVFDFGMDPDVTGPGDLFNGVYVDLAEPAMKALPFLSLVMDWDDLTGSQRGIYVNAQRDGREWERPGSLELVYHEPEREGFQENLGVRIRGGFSRTSSNPKHSFRMFFRNEYGAGMLDYPLFEDEGADEFDKFDLRTAQNYAWSLDSSNDARKNTFLREIFARDSERALGKPYTRSRYYHLFLNGQYWGIYQTHERAEGNYAETYLGGDKEDYDVIKASGSVYAVDGSLSKFYDLADMSQSGFADNAKYFAALGKNPQGEDDPKIEKHIDIDNLIDYMLVIYYVGSFDAPTTLGGNTANNFIAVRNRVEPDGWKFFAHDTEHSMMDPNADRTITVSAGQNREHFNPQYLHQKLVTNEEYRLAFADRVHQTFFNGGVFTKDVALERFLARRKTIQMAIVAESARWGDQHESTPYTKASWDAAVADLVDNWFSVRTNVVFKQFEDRGWYPTVDAPSFGQNGGSVEAGYKLLIDPKSNIFSGGSTAYITTDGSDPRLVGGAPNPEAISMDTPRTITLDSSAVVKARSQDGTGKWSAMMQAYFTVATKPATFGDIVISKLDYRPAPPTDAEIAAGHNDRNDFEYVELMNIGDETVNLDGLSFTDGIEFIFGAGPMFELAPGERAVIVDKPDAFALRYGTGIRVLGNFASRLSNDGERIVLADAQGFTIVDFTYNDKAPWPEAADGSGAALVLINPMSNPDPTVAGNWRASTTPGGNPGGENAQAIDSWRSLFFTESELEDPAVSGDDADPDGDSLPNLLEYAFGGDPKDAQMTLMPEIGIESFGAGGEEESRLVITYRRLIDAGDVTYSIEASTDAENWTDVTAAMVEVSNTPGENGTRLIRMRDSVGVDVESERFLRVKVTR